MVARLPLRSYGSAAIMSAHAQHAVKNGALPDTSRFEEQTELSVSCTSLW